ncbi:hypothetical protein AB0N81_37070 [Streptomyces sp. NPDC093510]|uniref:hypothetical protein n=1 Tax=Streptomyces sp. NPDC093510 TaxID=3155199 RepID=UPI00343A94A1
MLAARTDSVDPFLPRLTQFVTCAFERGQPGLERLGAPDLQRDMPLPADAAGTRFERPERMADRLGKRVGERDVDLTGVVTLVSDSICPLPSE